ncbi:hypothetical cyanophage protein [Synechococcus phage S-CRM01]|uniref:hypothetical cyanophage protein n=1 Tax=Synechococcus phage S-CRM01 TaxID=1026955 RepID=UPI000209E3AA|nr:hypothetical cyanophage protein [Synechococcus phage S-CRM01]AEC53056.1 hypothetical cyanophage protein [Synechococcus phage S-CRM01]
MGKRVNLLNKIGHHMNKTMLKFLLPLAESVLLKLVNDRAVKEFVIVLLEKYAKTTGNDIDDMVVSLVREKLLK